MIFATGVAYATPANTLSHVDTADYKVLQEQFTSEEIVALNEMATSTEIDQLVTMIQNTKMAEANSAQLSHQRPSLTAFASWQPNGCTASPDSIGKANFKPACNNHDACYASFSRVNRIDCDTFFRSQLYAECNRVYSGIKRTTCHGVANTYYSFVRASGWAFYKGKGAK